MQLVFATHNPDKFKEVQPLMPSYIKLLTLDDIGCTQPIPETGSTLAENALLKARYVKDNYNYPCFADDTGLEVKALNGAPGVRSARYAGPRNHSGNNIRKLLEALGDTTDRKARFKTVIALLTSEGEYQFEGIVNGSITTEKQGDGGFGYDPVFLPEGSAQTFARMKMSQKNRISHRAIAIGHLITHLQSLPEENRT